MCNKSSNQFWKIWKNKFNSKRQSPVVDGLIDDIEIANHFANKFKDICTPNSPAKNIQFETEYKSMFSSYIGDQKQISFNVETVDIVVQSLKKDRAADIEGISAEHIIAAHPILIVILKYLFELISRTGLVPGGFGRGITHPIPKSKVNSKTLTADDFRAVTICPIISKVFEHCLLSRISNYLDTSPRQFGFKKGTGCNHAIYMLRKTVNFFTSNGSTVNIAMLDLSKAFDKINHFGLFITLMKRNVPIVVINILANWYSRISTRVSFSGTLSTTVVLVSGVRQGGVLSPFFFSVYVNDLLNQLNACGIGCYIKGVCFNVIMYADDIVLTAISVNDLRRLVHICANYFNEIDMPLNIAKSSCLRIGIRYNYACAAIMVNNQPIQWTNSAKYLGVYINNGKNFFCKSDESKKKFYAAFNSIYGRTGDKNQLNISVFLLSTKCVPILTYGSEVCSFSKSESSKICYAYDQACMKIFGTYDKNCMRVCQFFSGLLPLEYQIDLKCILFYLSLKSLVSHHRDLCDLFGCFANDDFLARLKYDILPNDSARVIKSKVFSHFEISLHDVGLI